MAERHLADLEAGIGRYACGHSCLVDAIFEAKTKPRMRLRFMEFAEDTRFR